MSINNQHKPGYKHTPLGWIPEVWEIYPVGKAFNICNSLRFPISEEVRREMQGSYPYYGPTRVQDFINEYRVEGKYALIGEDGDHFLKWRELPMTLLVEGKFNVNNHAHLIQGNGISITEWFFYYFNHRELTTYLTRQGAGRYKLTKYALSKMPVPLPSLPEQHKIAAILSTWDEAITKTRQLIAQLQQRNKGFMQQLLTPKGDWQEMRLSDIFERVVRKNATANTNVITISAQRGFVKQNDFFKKLVASETLDNYFLVRKGEFCYNKSYSNGYDWGATKRLNDFDEAVVTTLYICFRLKEESQYSGDYFEYFFDANILDRGLAKIAHEGGRAHGLLNVTPGDFFSLKIYVPTYEEQIRMFNILSAAKNELKLTEQKLAVLQQQKKGLMQKLLTGEVRVKIDN
jgi:type I restriction enzyme S subunit